jgi:hypothetical protein
MVTLFSETNRQTPQIPARLSYSEAVGGAAGALEGGAIDWGDVSFEEDPTKGEEKAASVELVFAGSSAFKRWGASLGDFYLKSRGGQARVAPDDPRVVRLVSVLKEVENVHVPAG